MKTKWLLLICTVAVLMLGLAGVGAYLFIIQPARETADQITQGIASHIQNTFNLTPQISLNSLVVIEERKSVFEIAVLSQQLTHRYTYENTLLFSTKRLFLNGVYVVKVGFDLTRHPFSIELQATDDGYLVTVTLPAPEILSLEMAHYEVQLDEDGWWNEITGNERGSAISTMKTQVREKALQSGVLDQARQIMQDRIQEIRNAAPFGSRIHTVTFRWLDPSDSSSSNTRP